MSRPNLFLNNFMGLFRSGLLACLVVGSVSFAQQPNPGPGTPVPAPGVPDTNAPIPAPAIPEPATPGVDPNALQPATPAPADATAAPAADTATAKPKPKKSAAPAVPTLRGTVGSIDKNAMTITVHGKSKDETLNVTSKTRIFADGKPAILSDAKEGENVVAEYHTNKEKAKDALTLRFGGSGSGAAKVENGESKPAPKKAAKKIASRKKKKSTPKTETPLPSPGTENPVTPLPTTPEPAQPNPIPGAPVPAPGTPTTNP
jgi:Cu/Ag efflux protein CusF